VIGTDLRERESGESTKRILPAKVSDDWRSISGDALPSTRNRAGSGCRSASTRSTVNNSGARCTSSMTTRPRNPSSAVIG